MKIGEATKYRIKEICEQKHITMNKLATLCGMTCSTLNNIVNRNHSTTLVTLKKICDGMDITIQEFFDSELFSNLEQEIE